MQSKATTVDAYLKELPADRRAAIQAVREVILKNLDGDYEEGMQYGMIGYYVPHRLYPAGYHCDPKQPLPFACLASQKNYMSLYGMSLYSSGEHLEKFQQAWAKTGKKLDMGKSCIRFKKLDDLALDVIADLVRSMPAKKWIKIYEAALETNQADSARRKADRAATKTAARPTNSSERAKSKAAKPRPAKPETARSRATVKRSATSR
jgi:hypothetical protein